MIKLKVEDPPISIHFKLNDKIKQNFFINIY